MFLGVLNTVFLNISNYLPHLEIRNCSFQNVVLTNFVVISNVGIKRFGCTNITFLTFRENSFDILNFLTRKNGGNTTAHFY